MLETVWDIGHQRFLGLDSVRSYAVCWIHKRVLGTRCLKSTIAQFNRTGQQIDGLKALSARDPEITARVKSRRCFTGGNPSASASMGLRRGKKMAMQVRNV